VFQGACAVCPLNTIFNSAINGCSCPQGFYMDTYGVCQKLQIKPITCSSGQYFDSNNGCVACSGSCATCRSATECITCATTGFTTNTQGVCIPRCGDGLIVGSEQCDTGSSSSPGCVQCRIQTGFTCSGQPSICKSNTPAPTPTPTPTPTPEDKIPPIIPPVGGVVALAQSGKTSINSNNVFITLKTGTTFTFNNPTEMQSFLQATFPSGPKPTVYCSQRNSPNLNLFDCLLIYPSGVPNKKFVVNFAYNYQGKSGSASINVDPLAASKNVNKKG
jgi:cysteine-rich repeat protein